MRAIDKGKEFFRKVIPKSNKITNKISDEYDENEQKEIVTGMVSFKSVDNTEIKPATEVITDLLTELLDAAENNIYDAMDLVVDKTPDGKIALSTNITFTNRKGAFLFIDPQTNEVTHEPEEAFKAFCKRVDLFKKGDQLARTAYTHGGMAYEIVVSDDLQSIVDVLIIDPATFSDFIWLEKEKRYAIYQERDDDKLVDLYTGNFQYMPFQPKADNPVGTVAFEPALSALIPYYQFMSNMTSTADRIAVPRYNVEVDITKLLEQVPTSAKDSVKERHAIVMSEITNVESQLRNLARDSDFVHSDTIKIETIGGGVTSSGIDIRAWIEMYDPLICNAFGQKPVMMGREQNGSYAIGTAEYEAYIKGINPVGEDLCKFYEYVADMFCRVYGFSAVSTFEMESLEWKDEKEKLETELARMRMVRQAEEYGWITADRAAKEFYNVETAEGIKPEKVYQYLSFQQDEEVEVSDN